MAEPSLELLQIMTQHVLDGIAALREDNSDIKQRLTALERGMAAMRRDIAGDAETTAHIQAQLDRLGQRVGRIETRLDIVEPH
jgi:ubiquinone biosynthesis protein UbiJ